MKLFMSFAGIILILITSTTAFGQIYGREVYVPNSGIRPIELSGPRVGLTIIGGALADTLRNEFGASPFVTQFGWQWEKQFTASEDGFAGLTELVPLIGGIEQGLFLPSLSFVVGLRTARGAEIGFGPNLSLAGSAYVFAVGITKRVGNLNFPFNLSVVTSKEGMRVSLLAGFNMAQ
ncbi:hypothetical protein JW960_13970 [candidate division KSB1 bacterium]|nr:hypothetical protein [candidate division KSB1 bacterium]